MWPFDAPTTCVQNKPFISSLFKHGVLGLAPSLHTSRHLVKMSWNLTLITDKYTALLKIHAALMHVSPTHPVVLNFNTILSSVPVQVSVVLPGHGIIFPPQCTLIPNTSYLFYHDQ